MDCTFEIVGRRRGYQVTGSMVDPFQNARWSRGSIWLSFARANYLSHPPLLIPGYQGFKSTKWCLRKCELIVWYSSDKPSTDDRSTNLAIILAMMQLSKKIPFDNPDVLLMVRGMYILSNVIILGIYLYTQAQISKKKGK